MIKSYLIFAAVGLASAADYCTNGLCSGRSHIACGNNGAFSSNCPAEKIIVGMTNAIKSAILDSHNLKRNTIAGGKLNNFNSARRMTTMQWDDKLAKFAELNLKRCVLGHDQCHNTEKFRYSGQNIAKHWGTANIDDSRKDMEDITALIDLWWSEYKDTTKEHIRKYPSKPPSKAIGHFTVMTADRNVAVGCAAIKMREQNWITLTLVCNYATTNMVGFPMYAEGTAGAGCKTKMNPNYPALCSTSEEYNVNQWF